jgi:putative ABC transport system permease protein
MLNFLKYTYRLFRRSLGYTLINMVGLAIGLAAGISILAYIYGELSFDKFHNNRNELYRVNMVAINPDGSYPSFQIPAAVGPSLKEYFPGINSIVRVTQPEGGFFEYNKELWEISEICYADSGFFSDFTFALEEGDPATVLTDIYSIVITRSTALAIFGDELAIGKVIKLNNKNQFTVTGIASDPPFNSSLQFKALISFSTLYQDKSLFMDWNGGNQYMTFIRTAPGYDIKNLKNGMADFLEDKINRRIKDSGWHYDLKFEPLTSIHLYSLSDISSGGSIGNIRIFSVIALLIILIACFNFTSLSTARAMRRSKETGIRKVAGASRAMLIRQFLGEAVLMSFIALILALFIIELIRPWYSAISGYPLDLFSSGKIELLAMIFFLVLFTGIVAGAYPAFYLASFNPANVLKGGSGSGKIKSFIPGLLVVLQFTISAGLISSLLVMQNQISLIRNFDPGFRANNVLIVQLSGEMSASNPSFAGNALSSMPSVISWSAVSNPPGAGAERNGYFPDGRKEPILINVIGVDSGFLNTLDIKLISGRNFRSGSPADSMSYLVNESYASSFGIEKDKIHYISRSGKHPVIGIVKDFNFSPVFEMVQPLILTMAPESGYNALLISVNGDPNMVKTKLEEEWRKVFPEEPFICIPLKSYIDMTYTGINRFAQLFGGFSVLAILVACLGLLGLSAVILQQRQRQLGIRRILGASALKLTLRETSYFSLLVLAGNILAVIPVWIFMTGWLASFSYRISITISVFVLTALITLFLAWIAVLWQSWLAARVNPVDVVKYE